MGQVGMLVMTVYLDQLPPQKEGMEARSARPAVRGGLEVVGLESRKREVRELVDRVAMEDRAVEHPDITGREVGERVQ